MCSLLLVGGAAFARDVVQPAVAPEGEGPFGRASYRTLDAGVDTGSVAWAPDGSRLATGSADGIVRLWDVGTLEVAQTLSGLMGEVVQVEWNRDATRIAAAGTDGDVIVWVLGDEPRTLVLDRTGDFVNSLAMDAEGGRIAVGRESRSIVVSDLTMPTGDLRTLELDDVEGLADDEVTAVELDAAGQRLLAGTDAGTLVIWDLDGGGPPKVTKLHDDAITSLARAGSDGWFVSGSQDQTVRYWRMDDPSNGVTCVGHWNWVMDVDASVEGSHAVSVGADRWVRYWDVETGQLVRSLRPGAASATQISLSPDGRMSAAATGSREVRVHTLPTGPELFLSRGHDGPIYHAALSPDGTRAASGSTDTTIKLWDVETGHLVTTLRGHRSAVTSVAFVDEARLVTGSARGELRVWDVASGSSRLLGTHPEGINSVAVDASHGVVASGCRDDRVRVWSLTDGKLRTELAGHTADLKTLDFSPDGALLASGSDDLTIRLWSLASGKAVHVLEGHVGPVHSVVFEASGETLLSVSHDRTLRRWDVATGKLLANEVVAPIGINTVHVDPVSGRAVTACSDGVVRIHDAERLVTTKSAQGFPLAAVWAEFTANGKQIVSASTDGTLRVSHAQSLKRRTQIPRRTAVVTTAAFPATSGELLVGSDDGRVLLRRNGRPVADRSLRLRQAIHSLALPAEGRRAYIGLRTKGILWMDCAARPPVARWGFDHRLPSAKVAQRFVVRGSANWMAAYASGGLVVVREFQDARHEDEPRWSRRLEPVHSLAFLGDGTTFALGNAVGEVEVVSLPAFEATRRIRVGTAAVGALLGVAGGEAVLAGDDAGALHHVGLLDNAAPRVLAQLPEPIAAILQAGSDEQAVVATRDGLLMLVDTKSGHVLVTQRAHDEALRACAASADRRTVLTSSVAGGFREWNAATLELVREGGHDVGGEWWLHEHSGGLSRGADGKRMRVRTARGQPVRPLPWPGARARTQLTIDLEPVLSGAGLSAITIRNSGQAPAFDVRVEVWFDDTGSAGRSTRRTLRIAPGEGWNLDLGPKREAQISAGRLPARISVRANNADPVELQPE